MVAAEPGGRTGAGDEVPDQNTRRISTTATARDEGENENKELLRRSVRLLHLAQLEDHADHPRVHLAVPVLEAEHGGGRQLRSALVPALAQAVGASALSLAALAPEGLRVLQPDRVRAAVKLLLPQRAQSQH